jgi:hypothetical protein
MSTKKKMAPVFIEPMVEILMQAVMFSCLVDDETYKYIFDSVLTGSYWDKKLPIVIRRPTEAELLEWRWENLKRLEANNTPYKLRNISPRTRKLTRQILRKMRSELQEAFQGR